MTKKILIPTDFSIKLLKLAFRAIEDNPKTQLDLLLVHRVTLPDSITELLFYSKKKLLQSLENQEFKESCQIILSKYEAVLSSLNVEFFYGLTPRAFQSFLEENKVNEVYNPLNYEMKLKDSRSLDILPIISESKIKMIDVDMESSFRTTANQTEDLSDLFFQPITKQSI